jgi:hypothetical protein
LVKKFFEEGLIEQQLQKSKTGRVRVIRLTDNGEGILNDAKLNAA